MSCRFVTKQPLRLSLVIVLFVISACAKMEAQDFNPSEDEAGQEQILNEDPNSITQSEFVESLNFKEPSLTVQNILSVREKYRSVDPQKIIPTKLIDSALSYFDANKGKIRNQKYLTIVDFSSASKNQRLFVINMADGSVWSGWVAHGSGSDRNNDGVADSFSNAPGSNASSLGYYLTAETYSGKHGLSLKLDGLSSTNSKARSRAIVLHGASYVSRASVRQGRSWGCLAVPMIDRNFLVNALKNGSLIYAGQSR
ncbi:MAG: murein L,D-transpeptidase catalytic domain family protein [Proteobacteria bacterium]|nr:MAG: murein L,D-transpeptidase catalytic domain family protein [Pseudomonadota bacterium]